MSAREAAKAFLVEDGFRSEEAEEWLNDRRSRGKILHVHRNRRATALADSGLVETAKSERASRMISAVLAIAAGAG